MTHEFKHMVNAYRQAQSLGHKAVMASVVALEGSSYRRPGVRMLLLENGAAFGAVSGGCVEKEIHRQAAEVFDSGIPKMMTYDGRFRLGCEGILHILLEPFAPADAFFTAFDRAISARHPFYLVSRFRREDGPSAGMGTCFESGTDSWALEGATQPDSPEVYKQELPPCQRLMIFGSEHDTVHLSGIAALMGWEVCVVVTADEQKTGDHFPGAGEFLSVIPEQLDLGILDTQTAVILMTHSYTKDLKYLLRLSETMPGYLGILGPAYRRDRLIGDLLERVEEPSAAFLDRIYGPAGLDVGAEGPQEIAVSVLAEILSVLRQTRPIALRDKKGAIHDL